MKQIFITDDGKEFENEKDAIDYEEKLNKKNEEKKKYLEEKKKAYDDVIAAYEVFDKKYEKFVDKYGYFSAKDFNWDDWFRNIFDALEK